MTATAHVAHRFDPALRTHSQYLPVLAVCAAALLATSQRTRAAERQVFIGVLEDVPGAYVGETHHYRVRVLFRPSGGEWLPLAHDCETLACLTSVTARYPSRLRWTIWYEGKQLGVVTAHTPTAFRFYASIGRQVPDPEQRIPTVGKPSDVYSGYQETPVQRPLVATAGPIRLAPSPSDWKPQVVSPAMLDEVWPMFRRLVPHVDDCRLDAHGELIPSDGRVPRRDDLKIARAWENRLGAAIDSSATRTKPNTITDERGITPTMTGRSDATATLRYLSCR